VTIAGKTYSNGVVYVVTENDTLYAIDGTNCNILNGGGNGTSLLNGGYPVDCNYIGQGQTSCTNTIGPVVGILSTPVIHFGNDTGTIYIVAMTQDVPVGQTPANWYHYLHAVDIQKFTENVSPVRIYPAFYQSNPSIFSEYHIQRPALLYANGYVYVGFSMMDGNTPLPNGSVFAFNPSTLAQAGYFAVTPDQTTQQGGGVWQGGAGLAYGPDETGTDYIFFNSGNGNWDGSANFGDSFVKLNPAPNASSQLTLADYFTPADQYYRNCRPPNYTDLDFGSGGVMLTPATANWPSIAVTGDKEGGMWVIDRKGPGEFTNHSACDVCPPSGTSCTNTVNSNNLQTVWVGGSNTGPVIHTNAAYWNNNVYLAPVGNPMSQYQLCSSTSQNPFCNNTPVPGVDSSGNKVNFTYGATPFISANSTSNGVAWGIVADGTAQGTKNGVLWAFNATTMSGLYTSSNTTCTNDAIGPGTKFSIPAIANGYVYVGTRAQPTVNNGNAGMFYIFGLNRTCP
jgi:hypothetical protein